MCSTHCVQCIYNVSRKKNLHFQIDIEWNENVNAVYWPYQTMGSKTSMKCNSDLWVVPSAWTWAISIQTPSTALVFFTFNTHYTNAADRNVFLLLLCLVILMLVRTPEFCGLSISTYYHQWMFAWIQKSGKFFV